MNINEVEKWMKETLDKEVYTPREEGWDKLHAAMSPAKTSKRGVLFLSKPFAATFKIAASVMLILTSLATIYLIMQQRDNAKETTARQNKNTNHIPGVPAMAKKEVKIPNAKYTAIVKTQLPHSTTTLQKNIVNLPAYTVPDSMVQQNVSIVQADTEKLLLAKALKPEVQQEKPISVWHDEEPKDGTSTKGRHRPINLGIAAQVGNASVGNMQYQIGVLVQKSISDRFYARTILALATTQVSHGQQNNFTSVVSPPPSISNSLGAPSIEEKTIDAKYAQNIVSVGFSPNIGYRISAHFAMSCGITAYRNLSQSLALQNEKTIDPTLIDNNIISKDMPISKWNTGATGSLFYYANNKLAIDVQYRYGLSSYMYFNNQSLRNSGFGVGINYLFGNQR